MTDHDERMKAMFSEIGAYDARFLKEIGKHPSQVLNRKERRKLNKKSLLNWKKLRKSWINMVDSGAGYPIDQLIRSFAHDYTHRSNAHGTYTMPMSFNIIEAFLKYQVISSLPLFKPRKEKDHIFNLIDYLDWATSTDSPESHIKCAKNLPEEVIYLYTPLGSIDDLSFLYCDSRSFVIAGFSVIRYGSEITWLLLGGQHLTKHEIDKLIVDFKNEPLSDGKADDIRKKYLSEENKDRNMGKPILLEGTDTAHRSYLGGRFNLETLKHEVRYMGNEFDNAWITFSDDPSIFEYKSNSLGNDSLEMLKNSEDRFKNDEVLWHLGETFFSLPAYFDFKVHLVVERNIASKQYSKLYSNTARENKTTSAIKVRYKKVSALEVTNVNTATIRSYTPPRYQVEVDGFWRKLPNKDSIGKDPDGKDIKGKTWVNAHLRWREKEPAPKTIYVKSSVARAKAQAKAYASSSKNVPLKSLYEFEEPIEQQTEKEGWVYVMRCPLMDDNIYKIGFTHKTPEERAKDLSSASGVLHNFIVVDSWKCDDPKTLEMKIHAALDSVRVNPRREFFQCEYKRIREVIDKFFESP